MSAVADFFAMGGYAWYVWGSYGVTFLFMLIEIILVTRNQRSLLQRIGRMVRLESRDKS